MITPERRLSPGGFRREDWRRAGQNPAYRPARHLFYFQLIENRSVQLSVRVPGLAIPG